MKFIVQTFLQTLPFVQNYIKAQRHQLSHFYCIRINAHVFFPHQHTVNYDKSNVISSIMLHRAYILWQDENLHNENAEKDQTGAGDIVFEGRQDCCSVLKE